MVTVLHMLQLLPWQGLAFVHGVVAPHYHNWGVWLARNTPWMRGIFNTILHGSWYVKSTFVGRY